MANYKLEDAVRVGANGTLVIEAPNGSPLVVRSPIRLEKDAGLNATVNAQTGTAYTLQASDNGKVVTLDNADPITVTVPASLGVGFNCLIVQLGAGLVSFVASGTTLNNRQSFTDSRGQFAVMSVVSYGSNLFVLGGDLA